MTLEALSNLAKIGKIKAEPMNRAEIDRMLVMARKRLADSSYSQVSQEGRFTSVYNAIHGAALAALSSSTQALAQAGVGAGEGVV